MKQLSGLDATFLYIETPEMPMHVGSLNLIELPAGFRGRFATALRKHMAARLAVAPALRRKLWWMPLNLANPAWVDAEPDLKEHIVEVALPKGAGMAELEAAVGRLHPTLLDRKKPLWKFHVFEGLAPSPEGRRRVALYTQLHHAAVDGQAAVALANAILDVAPEGRAIQVKPSPRQKAYRLEMTEMLRGVLGGQAQKVAQIIRELPDTVSTLGGAATQVLGSSRLLSGKAGAGNVALAPRTAVNGNVGDTRAFACVSLPLAELKALGRHSDATVNDMVLMLCSSALRRYFAKHRALPKKSLIAAVPVSLREAGDTASDNQASMSLVSLGTHVADPRRRLEHIKRATGAMKSTMGSLKSVLPTDFPSLGVPWLLEAATALVGRAKVAERIPLPANLVISNVPGPPVPLYLAGARLLTMYPTSIVVHGMGLNITVQSYAGHLDFGLMADGRAMPDVHDLAEAIRIAFDDMRALPGEPEADAEAPGLVTQATRRLTSVVGDVVGGVARKVVGGAVSGAMSAAVSKVAGGAGKSRTGHSAPARRGGTR
jgi:WS/DGAT/MGAT family acyltransferase